MATVSKVLLMVSFISLIVQAVPAVGVQVILPVGDELSKEELLNIAGEMFDVDSGSGGFGVPWMLGVPRFVQWFCGAFEKVVNFLSRVRDFFAAHPVATNTATSSLAGGLTGGLQSSEESTLGKLKDAAIGALISGGVSYGTSRLTLKTSFVQPRFILNDPDGNFWGE